MKYFIIMHAYRYNIIFNVKFINCLNPTMQFVCFMHDLFLNITHIFRIHICIEYIVNLIISF